MAKTTAMVSILAAIGREKEKSNGTPLNQIIIIQLSHEKIPAKNKNSGAELKKLVIPPIKNPNEYIKIAAATITPNGKPENTSKIIPPPKIGQGSTLNLTAESARPINKGTPSERL